jgi:two-component system, OmpR family, response regulator VanR
MAQIMIVEDNQGTNKAICEYLKTAGHTLFPALDGEEALNILIQRSCERKASCASGSDRS